MLVNYGYLHQQFSEVDDYIEDLRKWAPTGEFTLGTFVERFEKNCSSEEDCDSASFISYNDAYIPCQPLI